MCCFQSNGQFTRSPKVAHFMVGGNAPKAARGALVTSEAMKVKSSARKKNR
jgi:hypothetical protein